MKTTAYIAEQMAWLRYVAAVNNDMRDARGQEVDGSPEARALGEAWVRAYRERRRHKG